MGAYVGNGVGETVGSNVGDKVGSTDGSPVGASDGDCVGETDVGVKLGANDTVGVNDGKRVGSCDGTRVGCAVGGSEVFVERSLRRPSVKMISAGSSFCRESIVVAASRYGASASHSKPRSAFDSPGVQGVDEAV